MRRRGGRKRVLGTRAPPTVPQGADQRCSPDFVSDLNDGRRFRVLNTVDDFTRECLATVVVALRRSRGARAQRGHRPPRPALHDRRNHRGLADRLQHSQTPYEPRRPLAVDVRQSVP